MTIFTSFLVKYNPGMKKLITIIIVIQLIFGTACKKILPFIKEDVKVEALFAFKKECMSQLNDTVQLINVPLKFLNLSDSANDVSYRWNFGDNSTSTEREPTHTFPVSGVYPIQLITYFKNKPSDTLVRNVRIIIGQKELKPTNYHSNIIDAETVVGRNTINLMTHYSIAYNQESQSITLVDSLLSQKWIKFFPGQDVKFSSIKKIVNTNDYILSGATYSTNQGLYAITKMNANADILWTKYFNFPGLNFFTSSTSDGGFITIGNADYYTNGYTAIIKCDANGNETWRKLFTGADQIRNSGNIIEYNGGFYFSAVNLNREIVITHLDLSGNIQRQTKTNLADNFLTTRVGTLKTSQGFMVYAVGAISIYFFDPSLTFLKSSSPGQTGINDALVLNNSIYLAEGKFQFSYVINLSEEGVKKWESIINHYFLLSCISMQSGLTRHCIKVLPTDDNAILSISQGQSNPNQNLGSSVYFAKYSFDGQGG